VIDALIAGRLYGAPVARPIARCHAAGGRMIERSGVANLALIETDAAEWAEGDAAAEAILVGNLDSESFEAVGASRTIQVQQRAEQQGHANTAHSCQPVAVGGAEVVAGRSKDRHTRRCSNGATHPEDSACALRSSSEVVPDRRPYQSYCGSSRGHGMRCGSARGHGMRHVGEAVNA
jgi:hypothetical protein